MSIAVMPSSVLDLPAHVLAPRLGAEHADAQRQARGVDAHLERRLGDEDRVARRAREHRDSEVLEDLHLALRVAARHRDGQRTEPLGPVVRAEPAGEQPVAVGDLDDVVGRCPRRRERARHEVRPAVDVALRVADDGDLAGRTRRRVHADDVAQRGGEHAVRVGRAQVVLDRERHASQVVERDDALGVEPGLIELVSVEPDVVVDAS